MDPEASADTMMGSKQIEELRVGDYVAVDYEEYARIVSVIKFDFGEKEMVHLKSCDLCVSPWYPVSDGDFYVYAKDAEGLSPEPYFSEDTVLYNFILDSTSPTMQVNGVDVPVLGHNSKYWLIKHKYWGGEILKDLEKYEPDSSGIINIYQADIKRNSEGEIISIIPS